MITFTRSLSSFFVFLFTLTVVSLLFGPPNAMAQEEVRLTSIASDEEAEETVEGNEYGPFTGFFVGKTTGLEGDLLLNYDTHTLNYDLLEEDNHFLMGFEVGYAWRTKYLVEFAFSFEGLFTSNNVEAVLADAPTANSDIAEASVDLNTVSFMLNGQMTFDLHRVRCRMGNIVPRFRPYIGAGIGGAQNWFRNQEITSVGDLAGIPTTPSLDIFAVDEFVLTHQVSAGIEFRILKEIDIYFEYRNKVLLSAGEIDDLENSMVIMGLQYRY